MSGKFINFEEILKKGFLLGGSLPDYSEINDKNPENPEIPERLRTGAMAKILKNQGFLKEANEIQRSIEKIVCVNRFWKDPLVFKISEREFSEDGVELSLNKSGLSTVTIQWGIGASEKEAIKRVIGEASLGIKLYLLPEEGLKTGNATWSNLNFQGKLTINNIPKETSMVRCILTLSAMNKTVTIRSTPRVSTN